MTPAEQHEHDIVMMRVAKETAALSQCASRKVGAVLQFPFGTIVKAYNRIPDGVKLCRNDKEPCRRRVLGYESGQGLHECPVVHAERQAIMQVARMPYTTAGATLYVYACRPCNQCMAEIIASGIKRLVFMQRDGYDHLSAIMLAQSGIEWVTLTDEEVG